LNGVNVGVEGVAVGVGVGTGTGTGAPGIIGLGEPPPRRWFASISKISVPRPPNVKSR